MKNNYQIVPVSEDNYPLFDDMLFWREHGYERPAGQGTVTETVRKELENSNLRLFAAASDGRYVGWISLVYIPKVSKWRGHGHVYVDELWVAPQYRRQGVAAALMEQADEALENTVAKIEPAMVLLASLLVGAILLSVMLPLMNIMSAIG